VISIAALKFKDKGDGMLALPRDVFSHHLLKIAGFCQSDCKMFACNAWSLAGGPAK
jgi:hypothetical protein